MYRQGKRKKAIEMVIYLNGKLCILRFVSNVKMSVYCLENEYCSLFVCLLFLKTINCILEDMFS